MRRIVLLICLGLVGCESSEETHMRKCEQWGASYRSPLFVECMARMAKNEEQDDAIQNAQASSAAAAGVAIGTAASR